MIDNGGGKGFPGTRSDKFGGPGSTGGVDRKIGLGGTPQGAGSSERTPGLSVGENNTDKRSTPRVSSKAMKSVTESMRA